MKILMITQRSGAFWLFLNFKSHRENADKLFLKNLYSSYSCHFSTRSCKNNDWWDTRFSYALGGREGSKISIDTLFLCTKTNRKDILFFGEIQYLINLFRGIRGQWKYGLILLFYLHCIDSNCFFKFNHKHNNTKLHINWQINSMCSRYCSTAV